MKQTTKLLGMLSALAASATIASGAAQLRVSDGTTTIEVTDQDVGDTDARPGVVGYSGPVGALWLHSLSMGITKPELGSAGSPVLDLFGVHLSQGKANLTAELTDTDFSANGAFNASIGGTTDGVVSFDTWIDAGNIPFAKTTPMTSQGPFATPSFGENASSAISGTPLYSITLRVIIAHAEKPKNAASISSFDAFVYVTPNPPEPGAACRTTGGGRQADSFPAVRYVTHGGQVGAPVGNETAFSPDSPCIQGNWQHVRHIQGGLRGNFHAKSFDSLMCACLGCPEDENAPAIIGGFCNPGMRTCGPEPRKAPANKITFSGVGDYALTRGNREKRAVLFRVDLEDRSEPGNSSAKGSKRPHDRHRIRIWILTPAELARLQDPNDRLIDFRMAISAGNGVGLKDGAELPNGDAVPNGTAVFGVRAPDIDDGGEMTHGNHQLHPSIKLCP